MPRVIFHVDMDAFFASIEQRDHPEYLGKPVIVGSPPDRRGVVCAASYEAREFKVRSAMPSRTAGRLCPHGIFVRPRMEVYRAESQEIMKILRAVTPKVERVSVDEAYLEVADLPDTADTDTALQAALPVAREIKRRIREERHLTASVGIASNKFLAKLGSDFNKPNGLTLILEKDKVAFLRPLSVRSIHGVGPVTAQSLTDRGLHTIADIQDTEMDLTPMVGSWAETLKRRAMGIDERPVDLSEDRKSISAENTFLNDTDDRPTLRAALKELAADVAQTLEKHALAALTVQVKVRYSDFSTLTRQVRLTDPVSNTADVYRLACHLLARHQLVTQPLRLIGIGVSTLVPPVREQLLLSI
ncbi:DNA polymerase-4 [Roseimicrobium gellanilyticum]|uniref:DNA polymerase IV n=1 Tax=Roseimicrobium gellanilyticum TaxID=748857 RepID=A0A366HEP6_9BACT|nr:DNA polymerase IV [Roseimicrobium gellanilyticum]RBP39788.1 DNA polymerase-4 [Roseimicrobium gellanilyticum]